jgi:cytochrome bd-type quinol oxidase subunit 2
MKSRKTIRFVAGWIVSVLILALGALNGGRVGRYIESHLGLTVLLPLALIFLGLLARALYLEYRQDPDETLWHEGATNAKA